MKMSNLKIFGILMCYVTATIFSVTYRFFNHTRQKDFYVSNYETGRKTLGKALEKTEKKQKMGCC